MADLILVSLALLHIVSAIAWLGGGAIFVSTIAPGLRAVSPQARLEFLTKIGPKAIRFFAGASTATIIFGALLFFYSGIGDIPLLIGAVVGIFAYISAIGVSVPAFRRVEKLANQMIANPQPGPPPAEFAASLKRFSTASAVTVILLVVIAIMMVTSGYAY